MQRLFKIFAALLAVGVALPARASTFAAMEMKDLVAASDAVARGRVVSVGSFWNEQHTLIVTEAVFEVEAPLVGTTPRYATLRTAGGTVDGYTVEASGFPTFRAGERALLFLERDDAKPLGKVYTRGRPEGFRITGYQLGHYHVVADRDGQEIAVPAADPALRFRRADGRPAEPPRVRRLAGFEDEIRLLGRQLGRQPGAFRR
jgi:hypothetical protein